MGRMKHTVGAQPGGGGEGEEGSNCDDPPPEPMDFSSSSVAEKVISTSIAGIPQLVPSSGGSIVTSTPTTTTTSTSPVKKSNQLIIQSTQQPPSLPRLKVLRGRAGPLFPRSTHCTLEDIGEVSEAENSPVTNGGGGSYYNGTPSGTRGGERSLQPNIFFAGLDLDKTHPFLLSGHEDEDEEDMGTPVAAQQTLCLNATSDANVDLTDDDDDDEDEGNRQDENTIAWRHEKNCPLACAVREASLAYAQICAKQRPFPTSISRLDIDDYQSPPAAEEQVLSAKQQQQQPLVVCVCSHVGGIASRRTSRPIRIVSGAGGGEEKEDSSDFLASSISFPSKSSPITDEYRITHEIIGIGESGKVMACFHRVTNNKYALKVLKDGPRSRREVQLHYLTNSHPNIVTIVDIFENTFDLVKCLLVVVEFLEGGDLLTQFESQERAPYREEHVASIIRQIGSAVQYLHSLNIAHRDIKLENILCSASAASSSCVYKLADFGFAKRPERKDAMMESPCCTPAYVCPEILAHELYDKSCDMWALGVVMYILICGYPPFYSMKGLAFSPGMRERIQVGLYAFPTEDWDHIAATTKQVIRHLLRTDPAERITIQQLMASSFLNPTTASLGGKIPSIPPVASDSSLLSLEEACLRADNVHNLINGGSPATNSSSGLGSGGSDGFPISEIPPLMVKQNPASDHFTSHHVDSHRQRAMSVRQALAARLKAPRRFSIQEEVGRALDMMRVGSNYCYVKSLKVASASNRLLAARRASKEAEPYCQQSSEENYRKLSHQRRASTETLLMPMRAGSTEVIMAAAGK